MKFLPVKLLVNQLVFFPEANPPPAPSTPLLSCGIPEQMGSILLKCWCLTSWPCLSIPVEWEVGSSGICSDIYESIKVLTWRLSMGGAVTWLRAREVFFFLHYIASEQDYLCQTAKITSPLDSAMSKKGNGFVCSRMYAFPAIRRLEGIQTRVLPHPITFCPTELQQGWGTHSQLLRRAHTHTQHTRKHRQAHTHSYCCTQKNTQQLALTVLNCCTEPWLRVPPHVAFIFRKTNPVKSVFTLLDGFNRDMWKKV